MTVSEKNKIKLAADPMKAICNLRIEETKLNKKCALNLALWLTTTPYLLSLTLHKVKFEEKGDFLGVMKAVQNHTHMKKISI